eukprot:2664701-Rhodomonas_salina.1
MGRRSDGSSAVALPSPSAANVSQGTATTVGISSTSPVPAVASSCVTRTSSLRSQDPQPISISPPDGSQTPSPRSLPPSASTLAFTSVIIMIPPLPQALSGSPPHRDPPAGHTGWHDRDCDSDSDSESEGDRDSDLRVCSEALSLDPKPYLRSLSQPSTQQRKASLAGPRA